MQPLKTLSFYISEDVHYCIFLQKVSFDNAYIFSHTVHYMFNLVPNSNMVNNCSKVSFYFDF